MWYSAPLLLGLATPLLYIRFAGQIEKREEKAVGWIDAHAHTQKNPIGQLPVLSPNLPPTDTHTHTPQEHPALHCLPSLIPIFSPALVSLV